MTKLLQDAIAKRLIEASEERKRLTEEIERLERMQAGTEKEYVAFWPYDCDDLHYIRVGSKIATKYGQDYTITEIGPIDEYNQRMLKFKETTKTLDTSRISCVHPDDYEIRPTEQELDIV